MLLWRTLRQTLFLSGGGILLRKNARSRNSAAGVASVTLERNQQGKQGTDRKGGTEYGVRRTEYTNGNTGVAAIYTLYLQVDHC